MGDNELLINSMTTLQLRPAGGTAWFSQAKRTRAFYEGFLGLEIGDMTESDGIIFEIKYKVGLSLRYGGARRLTWQGWAVTLICDNFDVLRERVKATRKRCVLSVGSAAIFLRDPDYNVLRFVRSFGDDL